MEYTDYKTGKTVKRKRTDHTNLVYGKVPPQAKDLEEAILGAMMLEANAVDVVSEWLKPEAFYVDAHQIIYKAILAITKRSQPVDILTVVEQLRSTEELEIVGGPYYVTRLTNSVVSSANIESHSKIVLQKFIQRECIRVGGEMIGEAYEDSVDVFDLLDKVERDFFSVTNSLHTKNYDQAVVLAVRAFKEIQIIRNSPLNLSGVPSGYKSIDQVTHGWQNTDLIILAARPGVGKTAFALNLARNAAIDPYKPTAVGLFSLEMSSGQLIRRILSSESETALVKVQRGRLDDIEMKRLYEGGLQKISNMKLFIDDSPSLNIFQLRAKCRRMKKKEGVGLIIIDYLQLMSGTGERNRNRENDIAEISRGLKGLAKELEVPIIALSQLSRAVETRGGEKMPQLSDLRESGAIEQDADVVMFMYRPEYYNISRDELGESNPGETHIRFAKHRGGTLETVKLRANLWCQKFTEIEKITPFVGVDGKAAAANDLSVQSNQVVEATDDLPF